ncbi:endolytic transglycosylase MltG [Parasphingopyxis algicola]|uniref:endolytic transglycosylase MltG n=1 Tax=Parasphingopyxis algicola TaxID=2026624 RepID=UPI0015A28BF4|nr:endolytic transglycosylase MltG [Parasphingopyxis algicola]QLC23814.1 endolytic transglycosylase MltG [Parasphingopyxis algicola]
MRKLGCLGLIVAGLLIAGLVAALRAWGGEGPLEEPVAVVIQEGETLTDAAGTLEEAGVIRSQSRFLLFARFLGNNAPIRTGEYEMPARVSQSEALRILQEEPPIQRFVTIPEGMPAVLVHQRLMATEFLTGEIPVPEEGSVLADSYAYERGESRADVLARMQLALDEELAALWAARSEDIAVSTPEEAIILASIVEKETAEPSERPLIAGVYSNRLRIGMRLQADPTIIYPITQGRALGRRIRRSEIDARNDYNTYSMAGLPRGPIANVGREAIEAVLNPAETDALFFVADGSGGHVFAESYGEHRENVERWYDLRRQRGEMD